MFGGIGPRTTHTRAMPIAVEGCCSECTTPINIRAKMHETQRKLCTIFVYAPRQHVLHIARTECDPLSSTMHAAIDVQNGRHEMQTLHHRIIALHCVASNRAVVWVLCLMSVNCVACLHMCFEYYQSFLLRPFGLFFSSSWSACDGQWTVCVCVGHFRNAKSIVCTQLNTTQHKPTQTRLRGTTLRFWDELSPNSNDSGRRMHMVFGFGFPNDFIFICSTEPDPANVMTESYTGALLQRVSVCPCVRVFIMILPHVCHLPI